MTSPPLTANPEQYVAEAARTMQRHRVERLPVVDDKDRLLGIVTRGDLLQVFLRTDEEIRRDVTDQVTNGTGCPRHDVDVTVNDGVVTLKGHLERRSDATLAAQIADQADGVVAVIDRLTHRGGPSRPHPAGGPWGHM